MCAQLFRRTIAVCLVVTIVEIVSQHAAAAEDGWGTLKGRLVYSEDAPTAVRIDVERDAAVCGNVGLVDESLLVDQKNRGIRNIAIWLETRDELPIHPELKDFPEKAPVLDNRDCRFQPHLLAIRTGQDFALQNSDPIAHNAAIYARRNTPSSDIIPMQQPLLKKFSKFETLPVRVDCSIHSWMKAWLIVTDHPYVAITDDDGRFSIANLPGGEWKFRFWHERPGFLQTLVTEGNPAPLEKGNWVLKIDADRTLDLGDLIAPAEQFREKKK